MRAQIEQMMAQQLPQMIEQVSQQMAQDPRAMQGFQKMAAALRQAQNSPPQMNATGDQATYVLDSSGDKELPPSMTFTHKDGKWVIDVASLARAAQGQ
jgi:hypothetical protein